VDAVELLRSEPRSSPTLRHGGGSHRSPASSAPSFKQRSSTTGCGSRRLCGWRSSTPHAAPPSTSRLRPNSTRCGSFATIALWPTPRCALRQARRGPHVSRRPTPRILNLVFPSARVEGQPARRSSIVQSGRLAAGSADARKSREAVVRTDACGAVARDELRSSGPAAFGLSLGPGDAEAGGSPTVAASLYRATRRPGVRGRGINHLARDLLATAHEVAAVDPSPVAARAA